MNPENPVSEETAEEVVAEAAPVVDEPLPEGSGLADGSELAEGTDLPEGTELADDTTLADGTELPEAAKLPEDAVLLEDVEDPEAAADPEDPEDDPGLVAVASALPDVTDDAALEAALESLLLVVDSPASEELLAETVEQSVGRVTVALRTMAAAFTERSSGIDLRRVGEGWRFYTRDTYAPFVEKMLLDGQRSKLTRAALESLAVIAYRQPVTRARIAAVRGVNVDGVIRTLVARGLIEDVGTDSDTGGTLYVTTELFLERLGLSSLTDLPAIAPLLPEVDTIDDI